MTPQSQKWCQVSLNPDFKDGRPSWLIFSKIRINQKLDWFPPLFWAIFRIQISTSSAKFPSFSAIWLQFRASFHSQFFKRGWESVAWSRERTSYSLILLWKLALPLFLLANQNYEQMRFFSSHPKFISFQNLFLSFKIGFDSKLRKTMTTSFGDW